MRVNEQLSYWLTFYHFIFKPGLDYNRDFSPRDIQQEVFEKQIQIACDLKRRGIVRPLFLHQRDASEDFIRILSKYQDQLPNVVVHCFTGTREEALKYLEMGFYIGLTGTSPSQLQLISQRIKKQNNNPSIIILGYISKLKPDHGVIQLLEEKNLPLDRLSTILLNGLW